MPITALAGTLGTAEPAAAQQYGEGYGVKQQLQQLQDGENR